MSLSYISNETNRFTFLTIIPLFFFKTTATTEIYTFPYTTLFRSHARHGHDVRGERDRDRVAVGHVQRDRVSAADRSEEHTSELQSRRDLVCRLLLEKKK